MVQPPRDLEKFESFVEIVAALRGPDGCPWDKEQTHRTLTPYVIEEAHELAEAIETGSQSDLVGELGDVLLQVVLHAEIGRTETDPAKRFDIHDVIRSISEKMVRRHPHVFSDTQVSGSGDVLANWSKIKAEEKKSVDKPSDTKLKRFDVPLHLPALSRSQKIGARTHRLRFDWNSAEEVFAKVEEELNETRAELKGRDQAKLEHEIGDLLFSVAQLARHLGLEAEQCLRTANTRFEKRYFTMKAQIEESGREYDSLSQDELEAAWQKAKASLKHEES
jgi:tetrapyrrole methylase family protein/MazG family protein